MAIAINDRLSTKVKSPNIDIKYGPYKTLTEAKNAIVPPGGNLLIDNGFTFGIIDNNRVTEYAIKGITQYTTVAGLRDEFENYIEKKISNATITIQQEGQQPQTFTLNQGDNVTITLSKGVITWNEITGKPDFATVATSGSCNDLSNKPTIPAAQVNSDWNSNSGVSQILNKPSNLVYFD
jgi:hypothetical protein